MIEYDSKFVPAPVGIANRGVTCWYNSLLQTLLSLPSFNSVLLSNEHELRNNAFACDYIKLIKYLLDDNCDKTKINTFTDALLNSLARQSGNKNFLLQQNCADEAFQFFLKTLNCQELNNLFMVRYQCTLECSGCKKIVSTALDENNHINLFTQIELDDSKKFQNYLRIRPSKCNSYKCEQCGMANINIDRVETLKRLGEIIFVKYNKYHNKENKWFPEELTFGSKTGAPINYKLVAKVEHTGNIYSGHYWATVLRNEWYNINDAQVTVNDKPLVTPDTYIFVYHLV